MLENATCNPFDWTACFSLGPGRAPKQIKIQAPWVLPQHRVIVTFEYIGISRNHTKDHLRRLLSKHKLATNKSLATCPMLPHLQEESTRLVHWIERHRFSSYNGRGHSYSLKQL